MPQKRTISMFALLAVLFAVASPVWAQFGEPVLAVGDWAYAEPWHNWIGGADEVSQVQLCVLDPDKEIRRVDFHYSIDQGQTWTLFGSDQDGYEPAYTTITPYPLPDTSVAPLGEDGWSAYFHHSIIPQVYTPIQFLAVAYHFQEPILTVINERIYDPTPPDDIAVFLTDWQAVEGDTLFILIADPYQNIDSVAVYIEPKADSFEKGIPGINQRPHSDYHCVPTAAAACLKYFESQGDSEITGGLSDSALVDTLGDEAGTNHAQVGTLLDDIVAALRKWIREHGDNYTVRCMPFDWETARNELERCQDVLISIRWSGEDAWHMMTFNSVVNTPNFDGTIRVDFMDPWTGEIEWGDLNPITGRLSGFSGAGPTGNLTDMLIICPKEDTPHVGPDSLIGGGPGPDPQPMPIPLPDTCNWFLHVVVVDQQDNACRFINIVSSLSVVPGPNQQGMIIPNFYLAQNDPNPFSSKTDIAFSIPTKSVVDVSVYNTVGQKVITLIHGTLEPGTHSVTWDGRDEQGRKLGNGIYLCELTTADGFKQTTKMLLVK
ncbi:hypothetical protein CEE36_08920 [candidate division TA06 bacterium B3_TA06]|uniref:FlgD/Vpr Ig-like domain-containing protein n=1 Tax=candidate division TA06 bacterium B3_TA06 TaxID=2012487 RepID=A0A532V1W4_UNCT6|nr:MAG: hypothetical protein CEE36_08920 [candidate division TA06 bacterium B3_TA06]